MSHSIIIKTCIIDFVMGLIYEWLKTDIGIIFKPILYAALVVMVIGLIMAIHKGNPREETI